jgi:hypothetical protein
LQVKKYLNVDDLTSMIKNFIVGNSGN